MIYKQRFREMLNRLFLTPAFDNLTVESLNFGVLNSVIVILRKALYFCSAVSYAEIKI